MTAGSLPKLPAISTHASSNAYPIAFNASGANEASSMLLRALMVPSLVSLAVDYKPLGHQAHAVAPMKGHEQDGAN
jgi:hypothetical protein